ncbi:MAG: HAD family hydrolase [Lachnospiraceae bacterium]|nr:HAD family hydrolase [Lachnospiraceae bacterium]MCI9545973.1 HAD family hydrolase [Lachnospiraceae bacterium]
MYRAILFDLDGTLTASAEGITKSVQYALLKLGIDEPDLKKLEGFIGPPLLDQFMNAYGMDETTARQAVVYYRERYEEKGIYENEVYPGVRELLKALKAQGYQLGVASSKPVFYVKQILERFGLTGFFAVIEGSQMDGRRTSKGEVIQEALKNLKMENCREQTVMVGDRKHDVQGAREAGIDCVAVSYGYGSVQELQQANPVMIAPAIEGVQRFFL